MTYDEVPYPSHAFPLTHPDHLCSIGRLFNLNTPLPDRARILELGCASGGNLLPLAAQFPEAEFVGIDLSRRQITEGQQSIDEMGIRNVQLLTMDLAAIPDHWNKFDYIICHGVYSWVSPEAQDAILRTCKRLLSDYGIAFISYNTHPGWYMRGMIRDMMRYHVRAISDSNTKVVQSRALLKFLADCTAEVGTPFGTFLQQELNILSKHSDSYLFHEHLEEHNLPVFFHDFVASGLKHQLQYLGESNLPSMWIGNLPGKAPEILEKLTNDILQREQYADFVSNRTFRQTLLCHAGSSIDRNLNDTRLSEARFIGRFRDNQGSYSWEINANELELASDTGQTVRTTDPLIKCILTEISSSWPASLPFESLIAQLHGRLGLTGVTEVERVKLVRNRVATIVSHLTLKGVLRVQFTPDRFTAAPSESGNWGRLKATPWARLQAKRQAAVTNLKHQTLTLDIISRHVIQIADGTRDEADLLDHLESLVTQGTLVIPSQRSSDSESVKLMLATALQKALEVLQQNGYWVTTES